MHATRIPHERSDQIGTGFGQAVQDLHVMPAFCLQFVMSMQETDQCHGCKQYTM